MGDWSELNPDMLMEVADRLNYYEDFKSFVRVCRPRQIAAATAAPTITRTRSSYLPYLILTEEEEEELLFRKLFMLSNGGEIVKIKLPEASKTKCLSSRGWLMTVAQGEIVAKLLHPLTRVQFDLPKLDTLPDYRRVIDENVGRLHPMHLVSKLVLSSNPSNKLDFFVLVIFGIQEQVAFCRPGDVSWRGIRRGRRDFIADITFHNGLLYAVTQYGLILGCNNLNDTNQPTWEIVSKRPTDMGLNCVYLKFYLVESVHKLLIVSREIDYRTEIDEEFMPIYEDYHTHQFRVFELRLGDGKWLKLENLGNRALFLGFNSSFSIEAGRSGNYGCIRPNCIYFTDDIFKNYVRNPVGGGRDMGIYDLSSGTIEPLYDMELISKVTPPTWVEPSV